MTNTCEPRAKRVALSKKTRFDVFKRDRFECQYCGAHPPGVLLHVDHVTAVANGGTNATDNLVTACQPCNAGKGARSLTVIPESFAVKAKRVAESEAQLAGYQAILSAKRDRIDWDMWQVAELIERGCGISGMRSDWLGSVKRFNESLGVHEVMLSAESANERHSSLSKQNRFRYFCGICWKKIKGQADGAR